MNFLKEYIFTYLEYSKIFNDKLPLTKINEIIENWNCYPYTILLSILSFYEMNDKDLSKILFDYLVKNEPQSGEEFSNILNDSIICSPQGLLTTWKYILTNQKNANKSVSGNIEFGVLQVMLLVVAIQDHLVKEDIANQEFLSYIISNYHFNNFENMRNAISRTWLMYFEPGIISRLQSSKEYVNYPDSFYNKYGYSLEDYLASIFAIISFYEKQPKGFNKPWILNIREYFTDTSLKAIIQEIISSISFSWEEGRTWSSEVIQDNWNFALFQQKPLLRITPNEVIPVSKKFLQEQLFESLFHKIRDSFPKENLSFVRYIGRPFEMYVQWISEESINKSNISYELIKEFAYNKNQNKSPDVIIKLGDKILVIEAKSSRISFEALDNFDFIDNTFDKFVISPMNQAIKSIKKIIDSKSHDLITSSNKYYFMVVSMSTFPSIKIYEDKIQKKIINDSGLDIQGLYHLDIEEFEYLCEIIGRRGSKQIFRLLQNKSRNYHNYTFKNFLLKSSIHLRKYTLLSDKANDLFEMVFTRLQRR